MKKAKSTLIGVVLLLSIGLNLFVLGQFAARHLDLGGFPKYPLMERAMHDAKKLPRDQREAVEGVIARYEPKLEAQFRDLMQARRAVDDLMHGDNYSRERAEAAFEKLSRISAACHKTAQAMMLDIADVLPKESRHRVLPRHREDRPQTGERDDKRR